MPPVTRPARLQALLVQDDQGLVQRVQRVDRRRVVVGAPALAFHPVTHDQVEVEEPAGDLGPAPADAFDCPLADADRRESGGTGEALLATRIDRVHAPFIDVERDAAERRDRVHDADAVVPARQLAEGLHVGAGAGGGLRMHEGEQAGIGVGLQRRLDLVRADRLSPGVLDDHRDPAEAFHVLLHTSAEYAIDAHNDLVARLHQVREAGLHARGSGGRDRERERVSGLERVLEKLLHLFHHADEGGIQMSDDGSAHRGEDARIDVGGARAHQCAHGRVEGAVGHRGFPFETGWQEGAGDVAAGGTLLRECRAGRGLRRGPSPKSS